MSASGITSRQQWSSNASMEAMSRSPASSQSDLFTPSPTSLRAAVRAFTPVFDRPWRRSSPEPLAQDDPGLLRPAGLAMRLNYLPNGRQADNLIASHQGPAPCRTRPGEDANETTAR